MHLGSSSFQGFLDLGSSNGCLSEFQAPISVRQILGRHLHQTCRGNLNRRDCLDLPLHLHFGIPTVRPPCSNESIQFFVRSRAENPFSFPN